MMDHTCSVDGCEREKAARGWCTGHYQRWYMTGDVGAAVFRKKTMSTPPKWRQPATCAYCREEFTSKRTGSGESVRWTECCSRWCARRRELEAGVHPFAVDVKPIPLEERVEARKLAQSLSVRDKHRLRHDAKRVVLLDVEREPYTRTEIAKRDGYQCQLCGQPVDMSIAYPHASSSSIDHVVPLSKGGDDTRKNVRLAHLGCNHARGNRV